MSDVRLRVNGQLYEGWKSVRITRSIEALSGSFSLDVSDRWAGRDELWPIAEEDECSVEIDGTAVITGYVGRRRQAISAATRSLSYTGKDRVAALVECSAVPDRWSLRKATVRDVAVALAAPFGISVTVQPGIVLPRQTKIPINPGDTPFAAIERAARAAGVLLVSDGGGLLITRAGAGRAASIIEGVNLLAGEIEYNAEDRFARYVVATQTAGTDQASGGATRVLAEATDDGVRRLDRVALVQPDGGLTVAEARVRAAWEARTRAARAETVSVTIHGWKQPDGALWPVNARTTVKAPALGVDGELLITEVEYSLGDGGELTRMNLVRPDAFSPEPQVKRREGGAWKEIAGGAL